MLLDLAQDYGFLFGVDILAGVLFVVVVRRVGLRLAVTGNVGFWLLASVTALVAIHWRPAVIALLIELSLKMRLSRPTTFGGLARRAAAERRRTGAGATDNRGAAPRS